MANSLQVEQKHTLLDCVNCLRDVFWSCVSQNTWPPVVAKYTTSRWVWDVKVLGVFGRDLSFRRRHVQLVRRILRRALSDSSEVIRRCICTGRKNAQTFICACTLFVFACLYCRCLSCRSLFFSSPISRARQSTINTHKNCFNVAISWLPPPSPSHQLLGC